MQYQITTPGPLLKDDGTLRQSGYSTHPVLTYNRENIKAAPWRIKEWDFYQVSNDRYCVQITIGHLSYIGSVNAVFLDLEKGQRICSEKRLLLPFNRLSMPRSAEEGDLRYQSKYFDVAFTLGDRQRKLYAKITDPKQVPVDIEIVLDQPYDASVVMATPFDEDPHAFYYNYKINCMPASGHAVFGEREWILNPENTFGLLDWGRGVWPFSHEWFWSNGSTRIDGELFGFNLGYGFGNTSAATENMLFYQGQCHKLEEVRFNIPKDGYTQPWTITSSDKRFEMEFLPVFDNYTENKMLFIQTACHQVFGRFSGEAVLDDGRVLQVKDMMAFAEHAVNRW